jgi:hypothetical protein
MADLLHEFRLILMILNFVMSNCQEYGKLNQGCLVFDIPATPRAEDRMGARLVSWHAVVLAPPHMIRFPFEVHLAAEARTCVALMAVSTSPLP